MSNKLSSNELLELRRIAALLYRKNKCYKQSIELPKRDKIYKDAMETCRDSGKAELAQDLLQFFITEKDKECFTATRYAASCCRRTS